MNRKLRVLLLFPHYGNLNQTGSLRSSQIGAFLAKKGHEVTVFAPGVNLRTQKRHAHLKGKLYSEKNIDGVRVIFPWGLEDFRRSALHRLTFEALFTAWVVALMPKVGKVDVIVGAYPPAIMPSVGLLISKMFGLPYIFEVRDLMADALVANSYTSSRLFIKASAFAEDYVAKHCDHIITVSKGIKTALVKKGVDQRKITPVLNGYEPQVFEQADRSYDARQEYGWGNRFVSIYAGGLTQSYDIPTMLQAAEMAKDDPDLHFAIIGAGEKKTEYQQYCSEQALDNVQFLDVQPRLRMPAILSAADVGLHMFRDDPLWHYVLGNKPFDYLGSGLPMIYCGEGDTADLIRNSGGGFVVRSERPDLLLEKIRWLKEHPEERKKKGRQAQKYVQENCNRLELLEVFDSVLHRVANRTC
jgi:putative colanic acid biosynthesis glycosyltransferase WcaI